MLFSSNWTINNKTIYIVNIYDVSSIYKERDRQMQDILKADIIILIVSFVIISIFSVFVTNPIKKLNIASKKISSGEFNERVNVNSKDEIRRTG